MADFLFKSVRVSVERHYGGIMIQRRPDGGKQGIGLSDSIKMFIFADKYPNNRYEQEI